MLHFTDDRANLPPEFTDIIGEACEILGRIWKWIVPQALKNSLALILGSNSQIKKLFLKCSNLKKNAQQTFQTFPTIHQWTRPEHPGRPDYLIDKCPKNDSVLAKHSACGL